MSLPQADIHVLATEKFCEVYNNHTSICKLIQYNQQELLRNPFRMIRLIRDLRRWSYDAVFSSSNPNTLSLSQALLARIITSGRSVGFKWDASEQLYTDAVEGRTTVFYADAQVDLWRHFDKSAVYTPPALYFLARAQPRKRSGILIWIGATGGKILPPKLILDMRNLLEEISVNITLAAGPADKLLTDDYPHDLSRRVKILKGSLKETAQYFRKFKVLIMPDTGPMHLAAALNIPLVQIFINSNDIWYGYTGQNRLIVRGEPDMKQVGRFVEDHIKSISILH
jgi:ADP-heptose:LPS heptosyltransferase